MNISLHIFAFCFVFLSRGTAVGVTLLGTPKQIYNGRTEIRTDGRIDERIDAAVGVRDDQADILNQRVDRHPGSLQYCEHSKDYGARDVGEKHDKQDARCLPVVSPSFSHLGHRLDSLAIEPHVDDDGAVQDQREGDGNKEEKKGGEDDLDIIEGFPHVEYPARER